MIETVVQDRNIKLAEYLQLLRLMAYELNRAMQAMMQNSLTGLEDSLANQHIFSDRLSELADDLCSPVREQSISSSTDSDSDPNIDLGDQIRAASDALQTLNRRYSALIKYSSHSVGLMVSLLSSFQGQMQEDSGARLKQQTWSCQI
jgi:hypothetical protein